MPIGTEREAVVGSEGGLAIEAGAGRRTLRTAAIARRAVQLIVSVAIAAEDDLRAIG
jgi:hypothetical protein